jgi:acetyl esterase
MSDRTQLDALLTALVATGRPSSMTLPRPEGLQNFTELAQWLAGPGPGQPGEDRKIAGPAGQLALRVYRPAPAPAGPAEAPAPGPARPAVMFFHGGGWVLGGLDSHDTLCRELACQAGVVLVAVDYRLAPEHPYPAGLDDCVAATRWVAGHAADLGADGSRLAVAGDSSGASLAAAVALLGRDTGDFAVALQALAYPALDPAMSTPSYTANADDPFLSRSEMEFYWSAYLGGAAADGIAAPALARDLAGLPPAYVLVAGRDVLHDEGVSYARRLRDSGVRVQLQAQPEMVHGFLLCTGWLDTARASVAALASFLRAGLPGAGRR